MVIWISSINRKLQALEAQAFGCNILSDTAAAQFSPVLQGVLDILFRICNNLAFRLLVFGFSWFLKRNTHLLNIIHIYYRRRNMSVYSSTISVQCFCVYMKAEAECKAICINVLSVYGFEAVASWLQLGQCSLSTDGTWFSLKNSVLGKDNFL